MSPWHWLIVIGVAVLLFGARRLPDAARNLGRSARILRAELSPETTAGSTGGSSSGPGSDDPTGNPTEPRPPGAGD